MRRGQRLLPANRSLETFRMLQYSPPRSPSLLPLETITRSLLEMVVVTRSGLNKTTSLERRVYTDLRIDDHSRNQDLLIKLLYPILPSQNPSKRLLWERRMARGCKSRRHVPASMSAVPSTGIFEAYPENNMNREEDMDMVLRELSPSPRSRRSLRDRMRRKPIPRQSDSA